ncbi:MAG TPA: adenylate/guanylate cyclase domain-containing protein, partial [Longimicrobiales bacterium]
MDARSPGRDARPRGRTVFSFAAKLLTALLTAVGMVLVITLLVVRQQTAAQVRAATERVTAQSRDAFREMEAVQRLQMAHQGRAFTESPRTSAALEAALESGDMDWLAETARYELALGMTAQSLAAFTDGAGVPVITLLDGAPLAGDAAGIQPLVAQLTAEHARELLAYRVVRGRLYLLQLRPLELDARLIGTVAFGLPVDDDDADRLGAMLGAELCFVADDRCIAGTAAADETLRTMLVDHARHGRGAVVGRPDGRRLIVADAIPGSAPETWRVMAVPIEGVLRPFADIRRALHLSGLGAFALAVVLSTLLSRGLTRPVRALVAATVRVGRGDYDVRVPVARRDELGVLGGAFNAMTEGLRLKERYRGVLDKVVSPQVAEDLMRGEITLGGETREVTTLFADITAFSDLVDGMEPQKVIALLNECMARLEAVVHAHGGVVDKYIGDEIMVIFGAPVARADHVTHAVEAALDMQDSMQRLNEERACRGEPAITLAIGVHTGPAVAGNMGSPNRLNYTVVGDSVNLAKRLCSSAGAGRVVLTESTWKRVQRAGAGNVRAQALGPRSFKGFARPIAVVAVERVERAVSTGVRRRVAALLLAGLLAAGARAPLHAQSGGLPTLEDLGLRYSSASGAVQLGLSGRVDLEGYMPEDEPTWLIPATNAFVAGRARLFADLFIGERVYGLAELRADRGHAPDAAPVDARVEQAFLRVRPFARPAVMLQAGKFASPFGAYAARHHTDQDPLIRPPLPYDQRTLAAPRVLPGGLDGFLGWKDSARERRAQG